MIFDFLDIAGGNAGFFSQFFIGQLLVGSSLLQTESHDHRGRALRKGEIQRKDKSYMYTYTDPYGKRRYIYANDLVELREKEKRLMKDQLDGLDVYAAGNADLNFVFDRYITTKTELRRTTYTNYTYMYDRFVRDEFGKRKIGTIKYSDVLYFYYHLLNDRGMQINTLETIHTVLHPTFQLAVRDDRFYFQ